VHKKGNNKQAFKRKCEQCISRLVNYRHFKAQDSSDSGCWHFFYFLGALQHACVHCNMHVLIQKSAITMSIWYDILKLLLTIACFCIIMDCITRSYHRNKQDHRGELICSYHRNKQDHRGELICPTGVHSYMHKAPMTAKYASRPGVCVLLS
jgi:hypothetical protein